MEIAEFIAARQDERATIAQAALDAAIKYHRAPRTSGAYHIADEDLGMPSSFELIFEPEAILLDIAADRTISAIAAEMRLQDGWGFHAFAEQIERAQAGRDESHPDYDPAWAA